MKQGLCFVLLVVLLSSSCATLNIEEIQKLPKVSFHTPWMNPGVETNQLRIDLIRQTSIDTLSVYEQYHPVGFDLGNGLFFDLNNNLSFRLDSLLHFSPDKNFELQRITQPKRNKGIYSYSFKNDTLSLGYPLRFKKFYSYHRIKNGSKTDYMDRKFLMYSIMQSDTGLIYSGKRVKRIIIQKLSENRYFLKKRFWGSRTFSKVGNEILLDKQYRLNLTNNNTTLEINTRGLFRFITMYKIEMSDNKLFVYNKNYKGLCLEKKQNELWLYGNSKLLCKYKLIEY